MLVASESVSSSWLSAQPVPMDRHPCPLLALAPCSAYDLRASGSIFWVAELGDHWMIPRDLVAVITKGTWFIDFLVSS